MEYSSITIEVEPVLGKDIHVVISEALELSKRMRTLIRFKFNGQTVIVGPDESYHQACARYHSRVAGNES